MAKSSSPNIQAKCTKNKVCLLGMTDGYQSVALKQFSWPCCMCVPPSCGFFFGMLSVASMSAFLSVALLSSSSVARGRDSYHWKAHFPCLFQKASTRLASDQRKTKCTILGQPFGCGSKPMVPLSGRCTAHFSLFLCGLGCSPGSQQANMCQVCRLAG